MLRCGNAANASGPTFFLMAGKEKNPEFNDAFLQAQGAAKHSKVIMTPSGYRYRENYIYIACYIYRILCIISHIIFINVKLYLKKNCERYLIKDYGRSV